MTNFALLVATKTMPGAYAALKGSADVFLYPGHVNAITGTELCESLVDEGVSGVVAGFTAKELLTALAVALVKFQENQTVFRQCLSESGDPGSQPRGTEAGGRYDGEL